MNHVYPRRGLKEPEVFCAILCFSTATPVSGESGTVSCAYLPSSGADIPCWQIVDASKQCFPSEQKERGLFTSSLCPPSPFSGVYVCFILFLRTVIKSGILLQKRESRFVTPSFFIYDITINFSYNIFNYVKEENRQFLKRN